MPKPEITKKHELLIEALRRFSRFSMTQKGKGVESLTTEWTGLGSATEYKPVLDEGLMEIATKPNPGYATWWRLTPKGAKIVKHWLGQGHTYNSIERELYPDRPRAIFDERKED